ncbi:MAG: GMC oxidoreductase, partial [Gammaproteobacteria bacterium]|nr:GMC oxidoreductase [Gammaproteobacteria bacterium]
NLREQKARAVCVAGNVVETARILLNSESAMFPGGLANSSGHVGRNYMRHTFGAAVAVMPKPVNLHRGARQTGILYDEQRHDPSRGFAGGYQLQAIGGDPHTMSNTIGGWGTEHTAFMDNYTHQAALFITGEDPPEARNRISLHPSEKDANGLPVPVIEYRNHSNTDAMRAHAIEASRRIYESLGATHFWGGDAPVGCHNMGVARMSGDPAHGVTNRWGQAHDVPNLFVSDGSLFSSSAAGNPTLTIVALAMRQADHIAERMRRKEL